MWLQRRRKTFRALANFVILAKFSASAVAIMTDEKWENLIDQIEQKFGKIERKKEELEFGPGEKEILVFSGALGRMKIERTIKPLVLGQRGIRAKKRIGASSTVEYLYSDTEKVDRLQAFLWDEKVNDWGEIDTETFGT